MQNYFMSAMLSNFLLQTALPLVSVGLDVTLQLHCVALQLLHCSSEPHQGQGSAVHDPQKREALGRPLPKAALLTSALM